MSGVFLALVLIAGLVISLVAAISPQQRPHLWGWIFPISIVTSLIFGILIGLGLCVVATVNNLLPQCQGMLCELGQYFYIILGSVAVTLIVAIVLLASFGKKISIMAKERRALWIINSIVLAIPLLITLFFMSGIGNIFFS